VAAETAKTDTEGTKEVRGGERGKWGGGGGREMEAIMEGGTFVVKTQGRSILDSAFTKEERLGEGRGGLILQKRREIVGESWERRNRLAAYLPKRGHN